MSSRSVAFLAVVFSLAMAGCAQTEGEACEVTSDCESGLTCCPGTDLGVCQRETETCPVAPADDAGTDSGAAEDGGGTDAEVADGGTDAGTTDAETDAGEPDAGADGGAEADAGTDAGT